MDAEQYLALDPATESETSFTPNHNRYNCSMRTELVNWMQAPLSQNKKQRTKLKNGRNQATADDMEKGLRVVADILELDSPLLILLVGVCLFVATAAATYDGGPGGGCAGSFCRSPEEGHNFHDCYVARRHKAQGAAS